MKKDSTEMDRRQRKLFPKYTLCCKTYERDLIKQTLLPED